MKTIQEWDKAIKEEGLHIKWKDQIEEIRVRHKEKLDRISEFYEDVKKYPDFEIGKRMKEGMTKEEAEADYNKEKQYLEKKIAKLKQIVELAEVESEIRQQLEKQGLGEGETPKEYKRDFPTYKPKEKKITEVLPSAMKREPIGTTYYVDFDNGDDSNDGLSTSNAWKTLDKFTENARSSGDKCIVRRGMSQSSTQRLSFSSSGEMKNHIVLEADYDDAWGDETTATPTATLAFGSKTVTFTADVSSEISTGDWIYVSTEDNKEFSYEVESVSTSTVTLYLPYKGNEDGGGKTIKIMPSNPEYKITDTLHYLSPEKFWTFRGIYFHTTVDNTNYQIEMGYGAYGLIFNKCIFEDDYADAYFFYNNFDGCYIKEISQCRTHNSDSHGIIYGGSYYRFSFVHIKDTLIVNDSVYSVRLGMGSDFKISGLCFLEEVEFKDCSTGISDRSYGSIKTRNLKFTSVTTNYAKYTGDIYAMAQFIAEDYNNVVNKNIYDFTAQLKIESNTTKTRSGGGSSSMKMSPGNSLYEVELFEIPVQLSANTSKTVTVYFASDDNTDWDSNPTADELWIEAHYWGHASNNYRRITKSTGTVDFKTDTDFDQTLSVTFTPKQDGIAYIKAYYAKPKESGKNNIFYCDPKIEIS